MDQQDWPNRYPGFPEEQEANGVPLWTYAFWSWWKQRRIQRRVARCEHPRLSRAHRDTDPTKR